ncbi:MAG: GIY-YIG nuclease family protein, partial [Niameybacter sp.]
KSFSVASKEEELFKKALEKAMLQLEQANEEEKAILKSQISSLKDNLKAAEEKMMRAKSMAEQTKSGFVYIISNVGSFGENIYKIGMTRRLDPTERINELSNASVPFAFDIHATIYTNNAPELERNLHKMVGDKRVNKVNLRKEFFDVSLSEIEEENSESVA